MWKPHSIPTFLLLTHLNHLLQLFPRPNFPGNILPFPPVQPSFVGFFFFPPAEEEELSVSVYFSLNITREQNSPMCWERDKVFRQQIQIFQSTQPSYSYSCQDSEFRAMSSRGVLFRLSYFFFYYLSKTLFIFAVK